MIKFVTLLLFMVIGDWIVKQQSLHTYLKLDIMIRAVELGFKT